jgi:hypothetical protein
VQTFLLNTWEQLIGRESGPLHFRLIVQPLVAAVLAIRSARNDARVGKPPFFLAYVREPQNRRRLFWNVWKDIGRLFLVGIALDVFYQIIVLPKVRPGQSLLVAIVLAVIPYLLVRGLTNRILITWRGKGAPSSAK